MADLWIFQPNTGHSLHRQTIIDCLVVPGHNGCDLLLQKPAQNFLQHFLTTYLNQKVLFFVKNYHKLYKIGWIFESLDTGFDSNHKLRTGEGAWCSQCGSKGNELAVSAGFSFYWHKLS